ncbi:hypothetical protein QBC38DRAFT_523455 [Podospora fimiseda]|uniref:Uncharacterized protein n=1 Tax=Podospora fimiseda TaxID=252190 RepID=A0AAN7H416_9PEZI|nr:hypothetical protein QBC38DRAFT_523455 [Podospora fimiseda]
MAFTVTSIRAIDPAVNPANTRELMLSGDQYTGIRRYTLLNERDLYPGPLPVAFRIAQGSRGISIELEGTFGFDQSPDWREKSYVVRGKLGGVELVSTLRQHALADVNKVFGTHFSFVGAVILDYPFTASGDFIWQIEFIVNQPVVNPPVANPPVVNPPVANPPVVNPPVVNPPVANPPVVNPPVANPPVVNPPVVNPPAMIVAQNRTNLEMYIFPVGARHALFRIHNLDLLKLIIPPYDASLNLTPVQAREAIVKYVADNIWTRLPGDVDVCLRYDAQEGKAQSICGGALALGLLLNYKWHSQATRFPRSVNCEDLAAIVEVALMALGGRLTPQGAYEPFIECQKRFRGPFGYVNRGPLFGWAGVGISYQNCNNPFFMRNVPWRPEVNDHEPHRTYFRCHYWVRVKLGMHPDDRVIDVCKALRNQVTNIITYGDGSQSEAHHITNSVDVWRILQPTPQQITAGIQVQNRLGINQIF